MRRFFLISILFISVATVASAIDGVQLNWTTDQNSAQATLYKALLEYSITYQNEIRGAQIHREGNDIAVVNGSEAVICRRRGPLERGPFYVLFTFDDPSLTIPWTTEARSIPGILYRALMQYAENPQNSFHPELVWEGTRHLLLSNITGNFLILIEVQDSSSPIRETGLSILKFQSRLQLVLDPKTINQIFEKSVENDPSQDREPVDTTSLRSVSKALCDVVRGGEAASESRCTQGDIQLHSQLFAELYLASLGKRSGSGKSFLQEAFKDTAHALEWQDLLIQSVLNNGNFITTLERLWRGRQLSIRIMTDLLFRQLSRIR